MGGRRALLVPSLGVAALAGLVAGCSGPAPAPAIPRIVLLVSIDTLRADHLGAYGYERPTSPYFDALAEEGIVFENATSTSPWTLPAHASLLSGLYPSRHRLISHDRALPPGVDTLGSMLLEHGYATAAIVNSHNLSSRYGLDRGFEQFSYIQESVLEISPSTTITTRAMDWLEQARDERFFLFLHYYDVHSDYRSRPAYEAAFARPYQGGADGSTEQLLRYRRGELSLDARDAAHLVDLYDAGIRQMDGELNRLFSFLRERGLLDQSLLVVTSDHGEEFLEHGGVLHGRTQFQEVMRVPLLIRGPGIPPGRRIATPVSLVDVVPTILGLLGIPPPDGIDGVDLSPLWRGEGASLEDRYLFGEADHTNREHDMTRSVRQRSHTLHYNRVTRRHALYDLRRDPGEQVDVAAEQSAVAERLRGRLMEFMEAAAAAAEPAALPDRELSAEEIERLKSLGYLE